MKLTYANVVSTLALIMATTGTAYAAGYIGSAQIIDGSVKSRDIGYRTVARRDMASRSVDNRIIAYDGVLRFNIGNGAVGPNQLGAAAVTQLKIAQGAVDSYGVEDESLHCVDLAQYLQDTLGC